MKNKPKQSILRASVDANKKLIRLSSKIVKQASNTF